MEKTSKKKYVTLVTYIIAVVSLIVGLCIPLFQGGDILITGAFGVVNQLFKTNINVLSKEIILVYPVKLFSVVDFDVYLWVYLSYILLTVLALLALIPVCVCKKTSKTANVFAYIIEVAVTVVFSVYFLVVAANVCNGNFPWGNAGEVFKQIGAFVVPFGVTVIMLIVQSVYYKGGSGIVKLFLFILSVIATLSLLNLTVFIPLLAKPLEDFANMLNANPSLYKSVYGYGLLGDMFIGSLELGGGMEMGINICLLIVSVFVIVNLIFDIFGLACKSGRAAHVINCIRYLLVFLLGIVTVILIFANNQKVGLLLYFLLSVSLIQIIISILRACTASYKASKTKKKEQEDYANYVSPELIVLDKNPAEPVTFSYFPAEEQEAKPEEQSETGADGEIAAASEQAPEEIYDGPSDEFIAKLTNAQKLEFAKTFIDKSGANISFLPEYKVGENNKEFFDYVIVYYARIKSVASDGLIDMMYKENLLN